MTKADQTQKELFLVLRILKNKRLPMLQEKFNNSTGDQKAVLFGKIEELCFNIELMTDILK